MKIIEQKSGISFFLAAIVDSLEYVADWAQSMQNYNKEKYGTKGTKVNQFGS